MSTQTVIEEIEEIGGTAQSLEMHLDSLTVQNQKSEASELRRWLRHAANHLDDFRKAIKYAVLEAEKMRNV